jgi:putative phosphonate metabolism protein
MHREHSIVIAQGSARWLSQAAPAASATESLTLRLLMNFRESAQSREAGSTMPDQNARYAVYFVPAAESDLYRFGSSVLGYDCYTGLSVALPNEFGFDAERWCRLTEEPRRYGFHATLKAPFRLAAGCTEAELVTAFLSFAGRGHRVPRIEPKLRMLSGFTAIVPGEASPALNDLAGACTTAFDAFRAPMPTQERTRRVESGLTQSEIHNLDSWGYPYVFADFRFHMTLTGKIQVEGRDAVLAVLERTFERMCGERAIAIDRLALVKQDDEQARFRVLRHAALTPMSCAAGR